MPRKTEDKELNKTVKKVAAKKPTTKKATTTKAKKTTTKKSTTTSKKPTARTSKSEKVTKAVEKTTSSTKKTTKAVTSKAIKTAKKTTTKATATRAKKTTAKSSAKKTTVKKTTKKSTTRATKKSVVSMEYYDLPSVYDKTVVKILAQTPSCLFVYWEISEEDRNKLQSQYGEGFFQDTKPYLSITNETMNYSFETEINDYANSWYVHINDSDCKYSIKLIRKPINHEVSISVPVIDITSSNEMNTPNDHILFDKLGKTVFFRNVKTDAVKEKDISSISFINNIGRIYNIYDFYKEIYKDELNGDELGTSLSSSQFSSVYR